MILTATAVQAQINIGGNVYGGGNEGDTGGNTTVTVYGGDINRVYGGARMADVSGRAFVHLDAEHSASPYTLINYVFGGNDISGEIGKSSTKTRPAELTKDDKNHISDSWDAFVRISSKMATAAVYYTQEEADEYNTQHELSSGDVGFVTTETIKTPGVISPDNQKIYVGQLFGGGNGDYTYSTTTNSDGKYEVRSKDGTELLGTSTKPFNKPELERTYLELLGGSIVYAFGGGNNATVIEDAVICVDNPSEVVNSIVDPTNKNADPDTGELLTTKRTTTDMALNAVTTYATSDAFQIGSFFGGNNKAEMKIQPVWHLNSGKIRNIYSGGNEGDMTSPVGLLLEIPKTSTIIVDNIYGGCRKANVHPMSDGEEVSSTSVQLPGNKYRFPAGLSARVLVRGGDINNVYGGNDISGRVWGGTAVGIYTSVRGDVYGGGNGSYAYTDNSELKNDATWSDFYYDVPDGKTSVEALNEHRPNVEQVSLRLWGPDANHLTIIGGSVYVGGNSATVVENKAINNQMVQLKIGSNVIANNVFLGNNGEQMIKTDVADEANHIREGVLRTYAGNVKNAQGVSKDFSTINLNDPATMYEYMNGCAMSLRPTIVFDKKNDDGTGDPDTYDPYSSAIGSLYCGGNVGSMIWEGTATFDVDHAVIIYDKFVAGCNNSYVPYHEGLNAVYWGGVVGTEDEQKPGGMENSDGSIKDAIVLNLSGLKIQPMRWVTKRNGSGSYVPVLSTDGKPIYMANCEHDCELSTINAVCEHGKQAYLEWNTFDVSTGLDVANPTELASGETHNSTTYDINRRLKGGNIYGGCYTAGVVNGNVVINVNETIMDRDHVFANVEEDELGEGIYYDTEEYHITKFNSGVIIDEQGMDVLGKAMNIFGGGFGKDTEIWGSTTINLNEGYVFQIFGGAEEGVIGKPEIDSGDESDEVEFPLIYTTTTLADGTYDATTGLYAFNGYLYKADERYSTHINLDGGQSGVSRHSADDSNKMAETEFIYGGAFEGPIMGNAIIHLGNGRIFNSFAGSCNADICGHTETYVGLNASETPGFPWIRDHIYGGNDLGGRILGSKDFLDRVREEVTNIKDNIYDEDCTKAAAYIEYQQGRVDYIFGGCYGTYDYSNSLFSAYTDEDGKDKPGFTKPRLGNAFVNFRPIVSNNPFNKAKRIYGAGQGISIKTNNNLGQNFGMDIMQDRSYILIDIPTSCTEFTDLVVFGAGKSGGLGMGVDPETLTDPNAVSAVIDLFRGNISGGNVYGGSDVEGVTRRTVVNVPPVSTIHVNSIFGGAYGSANDVPCDVYEATVNYSSSTAMVGGYHTGIYGGNNDYRRTVHSIVNINSPVYSDIEKGWLATVYGAGLGEDTWSQYTEVNLNNGARVFEVYGGGSEGRVLNMESLKMWSNLEPKLYTKIGKGYDDWTLDTDLTKANGLGITCNANVYINKGANVSGYIYNGSLSGGYAYGAGLGAAATVSGTTYVGLHGGYVAKDIYGSGSNGSVFDQYKHQRDSYNSTAATENKVSDFTAGTNVYIEGGKVRRAYGGGYQGNVGYTELPFTVTDETSIATVLANDVLATTNVVIGIPEIQKAAINEAHDDDDTQPEYGFYKGVPTVEWNAYGGGEKGGVIGTAYLTMYNGYVGYRYLGSDAVITGSDVVQTDDSTTPIDERYIEKVDDETVANGGRNSLIEHGNLFGSGFDDGSYVDNTDVSLYGGYVRNSVYGGGEIAAVGRGETKESGTDNSIRVLKGIWKGGSTKVSIFSGHVLQNVFGGGKGFTAERGEEYALSTTRRYTDGYVFGRTEANVHGGEIGTGDGLANGYGNVFGGGNVGYVYSSIGKKHTDGFYYQIDENGDFVEDNGEKILSEGTKVIVSPYCYVKGSSGVSVNGHTYAQGKYVTTEDLNTIDSKNDSRWASLETDAGIVIHNAVFGGGNVTQGSDLLYAEATTVYGNATASLVDVFCRDLITLGEDGIGGLYGDGNLTFVDGYRELNITNYGTDYYGLSQTLEYEDYLKLNDRERAYFKLRYKCIVAYDPYELNDEIDEDVYDKMTEADQAHWEVIKGVCSIYAGRMMNTIQRADFCGVFGSRLVMKGAQDRIPTEVDYTNYTINRVGEVSLNQKKVGSQSHGNYFGIYNITKYLGALTSDVKFDHTRKVLSSDGKPSDDPDGKTYYQYKAGKQGQRDRNIGHSENELAMASGVYLELLKEPSRNYVGDEKIWGPVTGVIGLKLLATSTGEGGGYVYAKNIHGTKHESDLKYLTISNTNKDAITQNSYTYDPSTTDQWMESSGNFVIDSPSSIIDDCFPNTNSYSPEYGTEGGENTSPAHYWYIHGYFYVYNQEISAYTGSSQAYTQSVNIPLTITAQGNGKLWIEDIKTNLYADASKFPFKAGSTTERETEVICNGTTYRSNDPITYWDWSNLSTTEKNYFVETSYVCVMDVYESATATTPAHTAGEVLSGETAYNEYKAQTWYDANGKVLAGTRAFRVTNDLTHAKGFELAVSLDNPAVWDEYYTDPTTGVTVAKGSQDGDDLLGPTYKLTATQPHVFGQKNYDLGDLVEESVFTNYNGISTAAINNIDRNTYPQAVFKPAYMALEDCYITLTDGENTQTVHVVKHGAIPDSYYGNLSAESKSKFVPAYILTNTVQLTEHTLLSAGVLFTGDEKDDYTTTYSTKISASDFQRAYYCSTAGYYGGKEFSSGKSYQAVQYSGLSEGERSNFAFNYDALDIMQDDAFAGNITTYDKENHPLYSAKQYVNYSVIYTGNKSSLKTKASSTVDVANNSTYDREWYESLLNEKQYYTPISLNFSENTTQTVYVVKDEFGQGGRIYPVGTTITASEYALLDRDRQNKVESITFTKGDGGSTVQKFYYCTEGYTTQTGVTLKDDTSIASGSTVPQHTIITEGSYNNLPNEQVDFNVVAASPQEKSALYVSSDCDIYDFSQDRIFTVIYRYSYTEKDGQGNSIESISERHVLNIRVHFESGEPSISELLPPGTILPGSTVKLNQPTVDEGAFVVLGGGWELYQNVNDAIAHKNGVPYTNHTTPMYWYQDDWYVAYYAETYLGRTYSNPVPFSIANYHDLDNVMNDNEHHMYVDHPDVKRNSKIYIDNRDCKSDDTKSELDLLKDFFDLSLQRPDKIPLTDEEGHEVKDENNQTVMIDNPAFKYHPTDWNKDHSAMNAHVEGGANLDFILNSDVTPLKYTEWTPIGADTQDPTTGKFTQCFEGNLHGDGYTISGLNNSLFQSLCGSVYNLGVTGTFTSAGIVETGTGYIENCWIKTEGTPATNVKPLFNTPARNATMENGKYADMLVQIVNSYYPEENNYTDHADNATYGSPVEKPLKSFYNGEVAYNLNGFYLAKRYADHTSSITTNPYKYFTITDNANNTLSTTPSTGYYADSKAIYPFPGMSGKYLGYVESRYIDGDFIYAKGTLPSGLNERYDGADTHYYPIWPDDYIFFGQMLTYGYFESSRPYQTTPSRITKSDRAASEGKNGATAWLVTGNNSNRVYRAPAYFRNSNMDVAHFNIYCMVPTASTEETGSLSAYPDMTAIDFTGYNDNSFVEDWASDGIFNKKVLDFEGLTGFRSDGQTQNLLAYANESETNVINILSNYFGDRAFNLNNTDYKTVAAVNAADMNSIKGHLVKKNKSGNYVTSSDHLLVDRQDFNAPISYTFGSGYRMWYQRTPDKFVDRTKGWEGISIPFKAELVTTHQKGEITHFYSDSYDYYNNGYKKDANKPDSKVGHEYWLREFTDITETTEDDITTATATMKYPTAIVTSTEEDDKEVTNNFLWEYYYSKNWQKDANSDIYQTYYNNPRTYKDYPLLAAGTPYIIGFPGSTYYEFDLSGNFIAKNTYDDIPKLAKQTITFASPTGITIDVSDRETGVSIDGSKKKYNFVTNYLNRTFSESTNTYTLDSDGDSYDVVPAAGSTVEAFRPYFTSAVIKTGGARPITRSIIFSNEDSQLKGVEEKGDPNDEDLGTLKIYAKKHMIVVESALKRDIDIRIVNPAGITISAFTLEPGETIETRITNAGVYIVQSADGRYTKKLVVK